MKSAFIAIFCFLLLISSSSLMAQDQVVFEAPQTFAFYDEYTSKYIYSVCTFDFDGDGILDLAAGLDDDPNIGILFGKGDGTFHNEAGYNYAEDYDQFYFIETDDFDNDGDADLVAACRYNHDNRVVIFLNDGDGTFTPGGETEFPDEFRPRQLCLSDFDGDGNNDLAVLFYQKDEYMEKVSILLSNGDGTFENAIDTPLDWYIYLSSICASDFDNDGNTDLAVTSSYNGKVMILLGKGNGQFDTGKPIPAYNVGDNPLWLTASDFDLDGNIDLAVANDDSNDISILLNEGDGTFRKGSTYHVSYPAGSPDNIYSSDLNGDGYADLAVTAGYLIVFLGNGTGNFQFEGQYHADALSTLLGGDFDLDGDLDLLVRGDYLQVIVYKNNGDGTYLVPEYYRYYNCHTVSTSDFNGDGDIDLVSMSDDDLDIFLGNGDGTLQHLIDYEVGADARSVCIADYNGDSIEDLALINRSPRTASLFLGNGDGTFQSRTDYAAGSDPEEACTADFDGDGEMDLAITNGSPSEVSILFGNGDGTFQSPASVSAYGLIHPYGICASDFDGDGDIDLAVGDDSLHWSHNGLGFMENNGDGTFQPPAIYYSEWRTKVLVAADLDRDGDSDIVAKSTYGIWTYLNDGDGTFVAHHWNYINAIESFCISDFNHDRVPDIAAIGSRPDLSLLMGNGDGTFQDKQTFYAGGGWDICASDFDGDGNADLAAALGIDVMIALNLTPIATAIENESLIPTAPEFLQNFPNPFNPVTTLRFSLPESGHVRIAVYDAAGRGVAVIADRRFQAGYSEVVWDGRNENGRALASGIYFARMTVKDFTVAKKLVLLR